MGEGGRHARFSVSAGGTRTPAVAFGCDGRLGVCAEEPADATFRLERNCWNGAVEPRLIFRRAWVCRPQEITVLGEGEEYLAAVLAELSLPGETPALSLPGETPAPALPGETAAPDAASDLGRPRDRPVVLDRRGESPLAVLADARAAGGEVLAVCADVDRRLDGLRARTGGFSLVCYHALERAPETVHGFAHVVALDPPACAHQRRLLESTGGFVHLAWGNAELRFAQQMHELEYGLRSPLAALYRALRRHGRAAGETLESVLRGEHPGRPARLSARLVRVLAELELVTLDSHLPALSIVSEEPTALERSAAYRAYAQRHEDGRRYLSSPTAQTV